MGFLIKYFLPLVFILYLVSSKGIGRGQNRMWYPSNGRLAVEDKELCYGYTGPKECRDRGCVYYPHDGRCYSKEDGCELLIEEPELCQSSGCFRYLRENSERCAYPP